MLAKKIMSIFSILVLAVLILVSGCQTGGPKQTAGTYIGAAGGALLGSQLGGGSGKLIATAIGTFIGVQVGAAIGKNMDDNDRRLAGNTAVQALENQPDNRVSRWRNPNSRNSGEFVVTRTNENLAGNKVCRDYVHTVNIDGQQERLYGRACRDVRDTKGYWHLQ